MRKEFGSILSNYLRGKALGDGTKKTKNDFWQNFGKEKSPFIQKEL